MVRPKAQLREWKRTARELSRCSPAHALACRQGFVLTRDQARGCGMADADLRSLVRRELWTAPRRGVVSPLTPTVATTEIAATALALVRPDTVVSHTSAAALWGLPLLAPVERPSVTMRFANGGGQAGANAHAAKIGNADVGRWFGVATTAVSRTVVDVARTEGRRAGLVAADSALHEELTTPEALRLALLRQHGWPGVVAARWVVEHADGRAESPLESLTRLLVIDAELPVPDLQAWVRTDRGFVRVDGLWEGRLVVLEADGMLKYRKS